MMKIQQLNSYAIIPTRGSSNAAGYDLYYAASPDSIVVIEPHTTKMLSTGWAMEIPEGYFGAIFARSGLATKEGLRPANCVGVIDSDYRGEVMVALHNDTDEQKIIQPQERIAQLVIIQYSSITGFELVETLDSTDRGIGGFGSTGK